MPLSSDVEVVAAVPVLKQLIALAGLSTDSWKQVSSREGYTVYELPPTPALGLPVKCYRTQFAINADLDSFQRVLTDEASIREYDPTLKELRTLERRACTTLLYTLYASPSPWLIAPRDFCVWCATVFTTPQQLNRLCFEADKGSAQSSTSSLAANEFSWIWKGSGVAPDPGQTVYLQNSVTARESDAGAVPTPENGKPLVRGVVHCFGYVAFEDPSTQGRLCVTNYCCVDPAGRVPKWLEAAAISENTKKLRKMAALVETAAALAAPAVTPISTCLEALAAEPLSVKQPQEPEFSVENSAERPPDETKKEGVSTLLPTDTPDYEAASPAMSTVTGSLAYDTSPFPHAESDAATFTISASANLSFPQLTLKEQNSSLPSSVTLRNTATHLHSLTSMSPRQPTTVASVDPRVELLSLLARSDGWKTRREVGEVQYAELHILPEPLRSKDPLCMAMRVSTSVNCTLDTFAAVQRNPVLFPEIDPELVRVMASSTLPGASCPETSRESSVFEHGAASTARTVTGGSLLLPGKGNSHAAGQVRHYQFDTNDSFQCPWKMILHCTDVELTHLEGGRYGFHTPGVPAATHVWVAAENTTGYYRGALPESYHQHMQVRVFGVVAVAVPRSADTVRVSQYMLFDSSAPLSSLHSVRWHLSFQRRTTGEFLSGVSKWMECRLNRLCRLAEEQQRRRNRNSMVALDKAPLLHFLFTVHCAEGGRALESPEAVLYGDVLARSIPWSGGGDSQRLGTEGASGDPPLLVLSTVFPCSLAHLRNYMLFNSPRHRYALERGVHAYEELPSPPEFTAVRVTYGAASASFPWLRLTVLEAFGEVNGMTVPLPTLVLSRTGLDGNVDNECEELDSNSDSFNFLRTGTNERFEEGHVFCSGWVATPLRGNGNHTCAIGTSATLGRNPPNDLTPVPLELCTTRANLGRKAEEASVHQPERIVVTQYLSIGLPSPCQRDLDEGGLPHGCIPEQAALLQRFRDSVCTWSSIEASPSR
ncbi:hypothetical protein NXY56_008095 [Leishmania guyanensis]